jgi:hypothetical protein
MSKQLSQETVQEANARLGKDLLHIARLGHQLLQAVAEKVAPYLERAAPALAALTQIDWAAAKRGWTICPNNRKTPCVWR